MNGDPADAPLIYLDTNVLILAFETSAPDVAPARALLKALQARPGASATSVLTLAELLAPIQRGGAMSPDERRALYEGLLLDNEFIRLADVTRDIVLDSAELRRTAILKLPDSIHLATARSLGCAYFVSHDRDGRRLPAGMEAVAPTAQGVTRLQEALGHV
ncbi:MAG TPA: type II toxin-antitoxin system VapC family toxin [Beijerinckiaceae bacterium]|jgi:predicted nucleic acid-binding protein